MQAFAWVVIVLLWWLVGTVMKANKAAQNKQQAERVPQAKAAPQTKPAASPAPAPKPQPAAMSRADEWEDEEDSWDERDAQRKPVAPTVTARPVQVSSAKKHSDAKPFEAHMHTPVMGVQGVGTEGIDCCHDFMLSDTLEPDPADFLPMQEDEPSDRAKALLQGVIYSEILGRRPVKHYHMKQPNA